MTRTPVARPVADNGMNAETTAESSSASGRARPRCATSSEGSTPRRRGWRWTRAGWPASAATRKRTIIQPLKALHYRRGEVGRIDAALPASDTDPRRLRASRLPRAAPAPGRRPVEQVDSAASRQDPCAGAKRTMRGFRLVDRAAVGAAAVLRGAGRAGGWRSADGFHAVHRRGGRLSADRGPVRRRAL